MKPFFVEKQRKINCSLGYIYGHHVPVREIYDVWNKQIKKKYAKFIEADNVITVGIEHSSPLHYQM